MDQFCYLDRGAKRRRGIGMGGGFQGRLISSGVIPADECQLLGVPENICSERVFRSLTRGGSQHAHAAIAQQH
jgi:hypothetical protein